MTTDKDRLAEIKRTREVDMYGWVRIDYPDFDWLIAEVERLQVIAEAAWDCNDQWRASLSSSNRSDPNGSFSAALKLDEALNPDNRAFPNMDSKS